MASISRAPVPPRTRRIREVHCAIAAKTVRVSLRNGRGFQEPGIAYVRCHERDCQYVDRNEPPCPLRVHLFANASDDVVRAHLATRHGERLCYECLGAAIGLPHERVRDAVRRITAPGGVRLEVRSARCVECHTRRLTILVEGCDSEAGPSAPNAVATLSGRGDGTTPSRPPGPAAAVSDGTPAGGSPDARAAVLDALERTLDTRLCGSCLAFAMDAPLSDARRAVVTLHGDTGFATVHAPCGRCGRIEDVIGLA